MASMHLGGALLQCPCQQTLHPAGRGLHTSLRQGPLKVKGTQGRPLSTALGQAQPIRKGISSSSPLLSPLPQRPNHGQPQALLPVIKPGAWRLSWIPSASHPMSPNLSSFPSQLSLTTSHPHCLSLPSLPWHRPHISLFYSFQAPSQALPIQHSLYPTPESSS